jgi:cyclohexanecarboxylate-CoA ligase
VQREATGLEHVLTLRADPLPGQRTLESLEADPPAPLGPSPLGPNDVSFVLYTSGTTADPKGVLHTTSTLAGLNGVQRAILGAPDERAFQFPLVRRRHGMFVRAPPPARAPFRGRVRPRAGDRADRALAGDERGRPPSSRP